MKANVRKWSIIVVGVLLLAYVLQVVAFEVRLGVNQPENQSTIVIATFDEDGNRSERVVRLVEIDGNAYVAANHWPRAWYHEALENPQIEVQMDDNFEPYTAVPLEGAEEAMLQENYSVGFGFRFRTGFPPRYFMRLDPR
jgi:pyridoxine/pyridoxamine 5'-phosphate oxidase